MHLHAYMHTCHLSRHKVPHMMNQQPNTQAPSHNESMCMMDLMGVMPQHIQLIQNAPQHQTPPHLPYPPSVSQSCPLPSIPTTVCIESQNPIFSLQTIENCHFSSHNIENCPFPLNNTENCQFLPTNQAFYSHNNQYCPVYNAHWPTFISLYSK